MVTVEKVQVKRELIKLTDRKGGDPERAEQSSKLCGKVVRKEAQV